jgi:poly(A) polymerase
MGMLDRLEPRLLSGALSIINRLRESGFEAYFAGGAVRDLLLGAEVEDIDVATSARPEDVERIFDATIPVGRRFGVVVVMIDGIGYEVASFRAERDYRNGRHPESVTFSSAREDALRRDFTVNALFLDPLKEEVLDFVGGQADLDRKRICTVGSPTERFSEDKLRLMRAVRFACRLGFEIDSATFEAIRDHAAGISQVSRERIRDELIGILTGPSPDRGLDLLHETGLLGVILPEVEAMVGVEQPPEFHPEGDVFEHTRLMFRLADRLTETLALGILLHDVGKPPTFRVAERIRFDGHAEVGAEMAEQICRRLRCSNQLVERVVKLVREHLRFIHVQEMRESTLKRFLRQENFEEHLELHRLDCLSSHRDLSSYEFCRLRLEELSREKVRPELFLNGHDLIRHGLKPGPLFSEILTQLEDLQLEGRIQDRAGALDWLRSQWPVPAD